MPDITEPKAIKATSALRKRIAEIIALSGEWEPTTIGFGQGGIVRGRRTGGEVETIAHVMDIVDGEGKAQGDWAVLEKMEASELAEPNPLADRMFQAAVLKRLKALEEQGSALAPVMKKLSAPRPVTVTVSDRKVSEIVRESVEQTRSEFGAMGKQLADTAKFSFMNALLCLVLLVAAIIGMVVAYDRGVANGQAASKSEIAAASWANTPAGVAAHNTLAKLSEPTVRLLIYCDRKNWEGSAVSCFEDARRVDPKTINTGQ